MQTRAQYTGVRQCHSAFVTHVLLLIAIERMTKPCYQIAIGSE